MSEEGKARLTAALHEVFDRAFGKALAGDDDVVKPLALAVKDGAIIDVTEGVLSLYDLVRQSPDWGSGFYTADDVLPVLHLARALDLDDLSDVEAYIAEYERQAEEHIRRQENIQAITEWRASNPADAPMPPPVVAAVEAMGGTFTEPAPTPKPLVPSEALAVLAPDEDRPVEQHYDRPPVKEQVRQGPSLPTGSSAAYLQP